MTKSQFKKNQARLFNLRRDESLAYKMDRQLFPAPKTTHRGRMSVRSNGISKQAIFACIALAASI